jgi:hypothetical protein
MFDGFIYTKLSHFCSYWPTDHTHSLSSELIRMDLARFPLRLPGGTTRYPRRPKNLRPLSSLVSVPYWIQISSLQCAPAISKSNIPASSTSTISVDPSVHFLASSFVWYVTVIRKLSPVCCRWNRQFCYKVWITAEIGDEACNVRVANIFLHIDVIYTEDCSKVVSGPPYSGGPESKLCCIEIMSFKEVQLR